MAFLKINKGKILGRKIIYNERREKKNTNKPETTVKAYHNNYVLEVRNLK